MALADATDRQYGERSFDAAINVRCGERGLRLGSGDFAAKWERPLDDLAIVAFVPQNARPEARSARSRLRQYQAQFIRDRSDGRSPGQPGFDSRSHRKGQTCADGWAH